MEDISPEETKLILLINDLEYKEGLAKRAVSELEADAERADHILGYFLRNDAELRAAPVVTIERLYECANGIREQSKIIAMAEAALVGRRQEESAISKALDKSRAQLKRFEDERTSVCQILEFRK